MCRCKYGQHPQDFRRLKYFVNFCSLFTRIYGILFDYTLVIAADCVLPYFITYEAGLYRRACLLGLRPLRELLEHDAVVIPLPCKDPREPHPEDQVYYIPFATM